MNQFNVINSDATNTGGFSHLTQETGFGICDNLHHRYQSSLRTGDRLSVLRLRNNLRLCLGQNHGCPNSEKCADRTMEIEREEDLVVPVPPQPNIDKFGFKIGRNRIFTGNGRTIEYEDDRGNYAVNHKLDLDILYRYEAPPILDFLSYWKAQTWPQFGDFEISKLENQGVTGWLHVLHYDQDKGPIFRHFARNMIKFSGRDGTNFPVLSIDAPAYTKMMREVFTEMQVQTEPSYTRVFRSMDLLGAQKDAAMRRLEVPLYEKRKLVGSAALLIPE